MKGAMVHKRSRVGSPKGSDGGPGDLGDPRGDGQVLRPAQLVASTIALCVWSVDELTLRAAHRFNLGFQKLIELTVPQPRPQPNLTERKHTFGGWGVLGGLICICRKRFLRGILKVDSDIALTGSTRKT